MTRSDYLIQQLLRNELTRAELDELLEGFDHAELRARYSDALEPYFRDLVGDAYPPPRRTTVPWWRYGRWAAAVVVVAGAGWLLGRGPGTALVPPATTRPTAGQVADGPPLTAVVRRGQRRPMRLPDGSQLHLNADTRLRYPATFGSAARRVTLEGEAFFEVRRDSIRPFTIRTADEVEVRVLGTSFDVKAYPDERELTVTVRTGRVRVNLSNGQPPVDLRPDQQLIFDRQTEKYRLKTVRAADYSRWTEGTLQFRNTSLREVVRTLERWYDVDIVVDDPDWLTSSFSGGHQNERLTDVLESITFALDARYEQTGRTVRIRR
jgi:ferric-dicitrate binding protein FerR (iron transport regulator)